MGGGDENKLPSRVNPRNGDHCFCSFFSFPSGLGFEMLRVSVETEGKGKGCGKGTNLLQ